MARVRSKEYITWVKCLLELEPGDVRWPGTDRFEVHAMASPEELDAWLRSKQDAGYSARTAAGFRSRLEPRRPICRALSMPFQIRPTMFALK